MANFNAMRVVRTPSALDWCLAVGVNVAKLTLIDARRGDRGESHHSGGRGPRTPQQADGHDRVAAPCALHKHESAVLWWR